MALTFNPPEWLLQEYFNRKSPIQVAAEGAQNVIGTYATLQNQQLTQQLAQEQKDIELAKLSSEGGTNSIDTLNAIRKGRGLPPLTIPTSQPSSAIPPTQNQGTPYDAQGNPIMGPMQGPPLPGVGLGMKAQQTPQSGIGAPSPIIDHWNVTMGQGQAGGMPPTPTGKPTAPDLGSDPAIQEFNQLGSRAYQQKYGSKGLEKLKTALAIRKGLQEKKGILTPFTHAQILAKGSFDPNKEIAMEPPAPRLDIGTKEDQFYQKEWDKIVKETNPLTASSRSTLGMASKANFQADRAITTLSHPIVTNQEGGNVMADIAAIYQTGSPTEFGMSHQQYTTLYGKIQGAIQAVSGKPQDAMPTAIKQRLLGVLKDMKGTNSQVLKQQLDFTEKAKAKVIKRFPDEWKDIRDTLESKKPDNMPGQTSPGSAPALSPMAQAVLDRLKGGKR